MSSPQIVPKRRARAPRLVAVAALVALAGIGSAAAASHGPRRAAAHRVGARLVSAKRCAVNKAAGPITFVSPFLYDASAGIIDVVDAISLGYFKALCLSVDVVVPSPQVSPYELVASGKGTVTGEGSAADAMIGTAGGANLVALATFADTSDYALLTRPNIRHLRQLDGKVVGYHTVLPVVLSEMLRAGGAKTSSIHFVDDTSYDPTVLFATRPGYAALQAYRSNEPLTLEAAGYHKGAAFREYTPAKFGVRGTFNVQMVNGTFLKHHPGPTADFLRAELHALQYCVGHARRCVTLEHQAATAAGYPGSFSHALAEWRFEARIVRTHHLRGKGIGVETKAEWSPEARALVSYHLLKARPRLGRIENTSIAAHLYRGTKLVWPGS